ncbi:uncharacterized protein LOC131293553 [Anopheles ziemanni]|uniref:uncharacterized protein LOC131265706 n=1 Tax=Anopheles coustani TaxID=139045 RepID=UPI00265AE44B|nr:uncharacterized protein LOC131265706 [Anopheles coustani]XP_058177616.1 uncharacterized protein LOC131293553 [Anopheles ziemanni]
MSEQPQLIPGVVRKASVPVQQTVAIGKQKSSASSLIPGVVRSVSKPRATKKPTNSFIISQPSTKSPPKIDSITQKAVEEILKETAIRKVSAEQKRPSEWRRCPLRKTNKQFLNRTLMSMVNHNERIKKTTTHRSRLKLGELVRGDHSSTKLKKSKSQQKTSKPQSDVSSSSIVNLVDDSD